MEMEDKEKDMGRSQKLLAFTLGLSISIFVIVEMLIGSGGWVIILFPVIFLPPLLFIPLSRLLPRMKWFPRPKMWITKLLIPFLLLISILAPSEIRKIPYRAVYRKIPLFPNAKIIKKSIDLPMGDAGGWVSLWFTTEQSSDDIINFYKSKLMPLGWVFDGKNSPVGNVKQCEFWFSNVNEDTGGSMLFIITNLNGKRKVKVSRSCNY